MPELVYSDDELGLVKGWDEGLDPNIRRELKEAKVAHRDLAAARIALAERDRADSYRRAGIPDNKQGDAYAKVATADPTNPEAIKAEFEELFGVPDPEAAQKAAELAEAQRIAAAGGTQTGTPGTIKFEDALRDPTKSREEILELIRNAPAETGLRLASDGSI